MDIGCVPGIVVNGHVPNKHFRIGREEDTSLIK